jgi:hypothetical protein
MILQKSSAALLIIYDREDGADFGKLIATQTPLAFIEQHSTDLGKVGPNLRDFRGFETKIADILRTAGRALSNQHC